jgi:hypothetical protein
MNNGRKLFDYAIDLLYGASKYPCGWVKPKVYWGHFTDDEKGRNQRIFFDELFYLGFRRTPWQLVFPGQTAGIVKKIEPTPEGVDEYHIRFYDDGIIDCELEVNRFNGWHWVGPRRHGVDLLENILDSEMTRLPQDVRDAIRPLFGEKHYSDECVRK